MKNLGTIKAYRVAKETPLGYMISDGKKIFSPPFGTLHQDIKTGDVVEAFYIWTKPSRRDPAQAASHDRVFRFRARRRRSPRRRRLC